MSSTYPSGVAQVYDILSNDLAWLTHRWSTYTFLYGNSERRIDLLNEAAPSFFFVVEDALYDDVVLNVCRLCDAATTGRGKKIQENLTLRRLMQEVQAAGDKDLLDVLKGVLGHLDDAVAPLRGYRHKLLAHRDFNVATQKASLAGPSRQDVKTALTLIAKFLNAVAAEYRDTTVLYEVTLARGGGAGQLLNLLKAGFRYKSLRDDGVVPYTDDPRGKWGEV